NLFPKECRALIERYGRGGHGKLDIAAANTPHRGGQAAYTLFGYVGRCYVAKGYVCCPGRPGPGKSPHGAPLAYGGGDAGTLGDRGRVIGVDIGWRCRGCAA